MLINGALAVCLPYLSREGPWLLLNQALIAARLMRQGPKIQIWRGTMNVQTTKKRIGPANDKPAAPPGMEVPTVMLPAELLDEIRALAGEGTASAISIDQQIQNLLEHSLGRRCR
jgi:hypothetical protein